MLVYKWFAKGALPSPPALLCSIIEEREKWLVWPAREGIGAPLNDSPRLPVIDARRESLAQQEEKH